MKQVAVYLLIIAFLFSFGCTKPQESEVAAFDVELDEREPAPDKSPSPNSGASEVKASGSAKVSVSATVAYVFECAQGVTLYGAAEYKNTGDTPITITSAEFRFSAGKAKTTHTFTPMLSEFDVVMPGESSYAVLWLPVGEDTAEFTVGSEITLDAKLSGAPTQTKRRALEVDSLYLVENYPGFATLTGTVRNPALAEYSLNLIYAGFYDANGKLLGVWYLTKNALLEQGDEKRFVTHLKELPVAGLAENTTSIKPLAFAFMLS